MKYLLILIAVVTVFCLFSMGCANITPNRDSQGNIMSVSSNKFGADLAYKQTLEYAPDGKTVLKRIEQFETRTNADRILDSANKILGTTVDGAGKLMP